MAIPTNPPPRRFAERTGRDVWTFSGPFAYLESVQAAGSVAAPLLAGASFTLVALVLQSPSPFGRWQNVSLLLFVAAWRKSSPSSRLPGPAATWQHRTTSGSGSRTISSIAGSVLPNGSSNISGSTTSARGDGLDERGPGSMPGYRFCWPGSRWEWCRRDPSAPAAGR